MVRRMAKTRTTRRRPDQLRKLSIQRGFPTAAPGSVLIEQGNTRVLCTAHVSTDVPPWMERANPPQGWVTAEYNMLPGSTPDRKSRRTDGRATEIQRLIGRSLRAAVDLTKMPGVSIFCDCDVLSADGGTRTASITGAFVALADAVTHAQKRGMLEKNPILGPIAAVSVGIVDGTPVLDLDYAWDSTAEVDMNVVMDHKGRFIEVQGTGERANFDRKQLDRLLDLATSGIKKLIAAQRKALR